MTLEDVATELYGLAPEEFTAARNAHAKAAKEDGDGDLAATLQRLRRPSLAAWVLNRLVREHGAEVEQVLELGVRLRAAQGTLGAAELRALDGQRRALTRAVAEQAVARARTSGRSVSASVAAAVEETLRSAMVDPDAGAALATGLLTEAFTASGLEPVDLSRVVAVGAPDGRRPARRTSAPVSVDAAARDARARAAAQQAVDEADAALHSAREATAAAAQRATAARRRREEVEAEVAATRERLAALEAQAADAVEAEATARRAQLVATREERAAVDASTRARHALDGVTGTRGH